MSPADAAVLDPPPAPAAARPLLRGWIHLGALVLTLVGGPLLVVHAHGPGDRAALVVYTLAMVALFGVSASFHRIRWQPAARRRMRRADHATIFVGIAGTYTAVAALALHGWAQVLVLCLVWIGGGAGIAMRQVWLDAPKWAVSLPYVVVGWCALAVVPQLVHGLGWSGFGLLLAGGTAYTVGAAVYALRRPDPWPRVFGYHEVFHACTLVGAALHYAAIAVYGLPGH
ncbi:MAG: PAQR family membrane homeostasis protein TrhA [Acidimicrobiales bacterium]